VQSLPTSKVKRQCSESLVRISSVKVKSLIALELGMNCAKAAPCF
jgi:hypothetical protein